MIDGIIQGTISEQQGGEYNLVIEATNPLGSGVASDADFKLVLVGLEVVAPTLASLPAQTWAREETMDTVYLTPYVTNDGNPSAVETITWSVYTGGGGDSFPTGVALRNSTSNAEVSGTVVVGASTGLRNVTLRATNSVGFADEVMSFTVEAVDTGAETPVVVGWYAGEAECPAGAVAPTWFSGATFTIAESDAGTKSVSLHDYIANDGGDTPTFLISIGDTLPDDWTLTGATGLLTRTATANEVADSVSVTFTAENSETTLVESPTFTFDFYDDAAVVPEIVSMSATEGTNIVYVNFSEAVYTTQGGFASLSEAYEEGFDFYVNDPDKVTPRTATFVLSSASSSRLAFTLDGAAFTANNTISLTYTTD